MKRTMTLLTIAVLTLSATTAVNAEQIFNVKDDIGPVLVLNPCAGDILLVEGTVHRRLGVTVNDNSLHINWHVNYAGVKSIASLSGAEYVGNGTVNATLNLQKGGNLTVVDSFRLIGQGPVPNLKVKIQWHITANANGDVTVAFVSLDVDCN